MRRSLHLLLIAAILPGVLLPGPIAICLCAEISCSQCCAETVNAKPCCARHASPRSTHGAIVQGKRPCHGCMLLAPEKHQTPRPQMQALDLPDFAHAAPSFTLELALAPGAPARFVHPLSHAPPDIPRTLPLLI